MGFCSMLLLSNILLTAWLSTAKGEVKPCEFPQFQYGHLYYEEKLRPNFPVSIGKMYSYKCDNGFSPPSGHSWDYLHCTAQGWEPEVPCIRKCVFHYVENGQSSYWEKIYVQGQSAKVQCYNGYSLQNGQDTMTCTENGWSPPPKCIRIKTCSASDIQIDNGFFSESFRTYPLNRETSYRCKQGYVTNTGETSGSITCLQNGWSPQPSCIKSCDMPVFENSVTKNTSTWFKLNDKLDYECFIGYENEYKHTKGSITCTYYGWSDIPSCYDSTVKCGPPPPIDNGDITSLSLPVYEPFSSVDYQCQKYYVLNGKKTITCRNGKWSEPPTCLRACVITENIMEKHNIKFKWRDTEKIYTHSGENVEFECKYGYLKAKGSPPFHTQCINGTINYPTCV